MAQFGNRMWMGQMPFGLLGGPDVYRGLVEGVANGFRPSLGGPSADLPARGNEGSLPPQTNYPGIERPMPPMGGSVSAGPQLPGAGPIGGTMMPGGERPGTYGVPVPGAGGPTNYPGVERPMPPMGGGGSMTVGNEFHTATMPMPNLPRRNRPNLNIDLSQVQNLPAFVQPGGPTNYPGIERPMPPQMGGSVGAGKRPPGIGPIGGGMSPGGERPGAYGRPPSLPYRPDNRMPRLPGGPRGLMRGA